MEVFIYLFSFFIYIILTCNTSISIGLILVREVYHVFLTYTRCPKLYSTMWENESIFTMRNGKEGRLGYSDKRTCSAFFFLHVRI